MVYHEKAGLPVSSPMLIVFYSLGNCREIRSWYFPQFPIQLLRSALIYVPILLWRCVLIGYMPIFLVHLYVFHNLSLQLLRYIAIAGTWATILSRDLFHWGGPPWRPWVTCESCPIGYFHKSFPWKNMGLYRRETWRKILAAFYLVDVPVQRSEQKQSHGVASPWMVHYDDYVVSVRDPSPLPSFNGQKWWIHHRGDIRAISLMSTQMDADHGKHFTLCLFYWHRYMNDNYLTGSLPIEWLAMESLWSLWVLCHWLLWIATECLTFVCFLDFPCHLLGHEGIIFHTFPLCLGNFPPTHTALLQFRAE